MFHVDGSSKRVLEASATVCRTTRTEGLASARSRSQALAHRHQPSEPLPDFLLSDEHPRWLQPLYRPLKNQLVDDGESDGNRRPASGAEVLRRERVDHVTQSIERQQRLEPGSTG